MMDLSTVRVIIASLLSRSDELTSREQEALSLVLQLMVQANVSSPSAERERCTQVAQQISLQKDRKQFVEYTRDVLLEHWELARFDFVVDLYREAYNG